MQKQAYNAFTNSTNLKWIVKKLKTKFFKEFANVE